MTQRPTDLERVNVDQGAIARDDAALLRQLVDELGNGVFLA